MSAVPLRVFRCAWFGVWIFFAWLFFLLWVVNALNSPIIARARKKEKKSKYFKKEKKKLPGTLGGPDRHSQRPGDFIRKSVHMVPPDAKLSLHGPNIMALQRCS